MIDRGNNHPVKRPATAARRRDTPAPWGIATLLAIPAFLLLLVVSLALRKPPRWTLGVYVGASVLAFMGGWPGALLAQQFLRHKSTKAEFRSVFWVAVLANVSVFLALAFA